MLSVRSCIAALALCAAHAPGQTIQPPFDASYSVVDLGSPVGVPGSLGGLTLKAGDPNMLLVGGSANTSAGAIYAVPLARTDGHISGFAGPSVTFASAPNIDGGLCYGPGGVLFFTRYTTHALGQILPGSSTMDYSVTLNIGGFSGSVGAMQYIPSGYASAGQIAFASYNSWQWARATVTPSIIVPGAYEVGSLTVTSAVQGGPEGIIYVPAGSPFFPTPSILVCEYGSGVVSAWEVDGDGDPISGTRRVFLSGLSGAEGAYLETSTGDFLFSTFGGGDRVVVVRGFAAACPGDANGDQTVGFADLNIVVSAFNTENGEPGYDAAADFDNDDDVDFADLNVVLSAFNTDC